jgi:hypothetical protein
VRLGFRSAIKTGGGFLRKVDGTLKDYEFTARFKGEKKDGEWLYFVPQIQMDGAAEPIDHHMFLGAAEQYEVEDDGKTLKMAGGGPVTFGGDVPFGILMTSLLDAGFPEDELPDPNDGAINLEVLVDRRFRFDQKVDEKGNAKFGKRKGTGKNKGKEFDRTNTIITAVLGGGSNGAAKSSNGKKGKATDLSSEAADVLRDVIAKEDGSVSRKNLSLPVTKALLKNANKDDLKKMILDEDWQEAQDWLTIDKKGNLSVDE